MARIVLGVTGSVAAVRTPLLASTLAEQGHEVRVVATEASLYFFAPLDLSSRNTRLYRDADEWSGDRYRRGDPVLHIEFRNWADLLVVAPLDAQTLAKFAFGLSDNFLTCIYRAWDFRKPVVLAPAMNTLMWESPVTRRHLGQILDDRGDGLADTSWPLDSAAEAFARHAPMLLLIPPQSKRLACGDHGIGAMAEVATIAETIRNWSERSSGEDSGSA